MSEPTVLDVMTRTNYDWGSARTGVHAADIAEANLVALGIPADFPAADLPKAIAMWQRAQETERRDDTPEYVLADGQLVQGFDMGWNACLVYLRGES